MSQTSRAALAGMMVLGIIVIFLQGWANEFPFELSGMIATVWTFVYGTFIISLDELCSALKKEK